MQEHPQEDQPAPLGKSFVFPIRAKILSAIMSAAPEREDLAQLFSSAVHDFNLADRPGSFGTFPAYGFIMGSWCAAEALWCIAFAYAAWAPELERAMDERRTEVDIYTSAPGKIAKGLINWTQATLKQETRQRWLHADTGWPYAEDGTVKLLAPDYDPEDEDRAKAEAIDRAVENAEPIFLGALGWILLHELAHVHYNHGSGPEPTIDEERKADTQATTWLFEQAPFGTAAERADGLGCALLYMWMRETLGSTRDNDHPPVAERIVSCISDAKFHRNAWAICTLSAMSEMFFSSQGEIMPSTLNGDFATCESYLQGVIGARHRV